MWVVTTTAGTTVFVFDHYEFKQLQLFNYKTVNITKKNYVFLVSNFEK